MVLSREKRCRKHTPIYSGGSFLSSREPRCSEGAYHVAMAVLHDRAVRHEIEQRVRSLRSCSRGRWGKMAVDQMLWHVNQSLDMALGDFTPGAARGPLPGVVLKFLVLKLPWMKGAPTHPAIVAKAAYDFAEQQARCLELIEAIASKPIDGAWP